MRQRKAENLRQLRSCSQRRTGVFDDFTNCFSSKHNVSFSFLRMNSLLSSRLIIIKCSDVCRPPPGGDCGVYSCVFLSLLQLLQRSWLCQWRAVSSPGTELCVGSRGPRCRTSSGSARTTCWRVLRSARWLRAPRLTTTPSAS